MPACTFKELLLAVVIPHFFLLVEMREVYIVTSLEETENKAGLWMFFSISHFFFTHSYIIKVSHLSQNKQEKY